MALSLDLRAAADAAADLEYERDLLKADRDHYASELIRVTQERDGLAVALKACQDGAQPPADSRVRFATARAAMGLYRPTALSGYLQAEAMLNRGPVSVALKFIGAGQTPDGMVADVIRLAGEYLKGHRPIMLSMPAALGTRGTARTDGFYNWTGALTLEAAAGGALDTTYLRSGQAVVAQCKALGLDPRQWVYLRPAWEPNYWYVYGAMKKGAFSAAETVDTAYDRQRLLWLKAAIKRQVRAFCQAFLDAGLPRPNVVASPAINAAVTDAVFYEPWADVPEMTHYLPDLYNRYSAKTEGWAENRLAAAVTFAVGKDLLFGLAECSVVTGTADAAGDNSWWWPMIERVAARAASRDMLGPICVFAANPPEQAAKFDTLDKVLFPRGYASLVQTFGGH